MTRQGASENWSKKARRRLGWQVRSLWPSRPVRRSVQGVELLLPWSHRLPDYATIAPDYGQNLVRVAKALGSQDSPIHVIDIGANVGDSALQILEVTDARVLCVEADDFYINFLTANVGDDARVRIERALLTTTGSTQPMTPVRSGGTTRFEPGTSASAAPAVTPDGLRERNPEWDRLRLIKSDTDGHDVTFIPALARAWKDQPPVLFFEFDPRLTRLAGHDANAVWRELSDLGYAQVAIWNNYGLPVALKPLTDLAAWSAARDLDQAPLEYWDVAVVHATDADGWTAVQEAFGPT